MAKKTKKPSQKMQAWIEARKRHHLSHAQVHMARELGMNPAKLGKIDNHEQAPWKLPLLGHRRFQNRNHCSALFSNSMVIENRGVGYFRR